jgi:hypothetical protein
LRLGLFTQNKFEKIKLRKVNPLNGTNANLKGKRNPYSFLPIDYRPNNLKRLIQSSSQYLGQQSLNDWITQNPQWLDLIPLYRHLVIDKQWFFEVAKSSPIKITRISRLGIEVSKPLISISEWLEVKLVRFYLEGLLTQNSIWSEKQVQKLIVCDIDVIFKKQGDYLNLAFAPLSPHLHIKRIKETTYLHSAKRRVERSNESSAM